MAKQPNAIGRSGRAAALARRQSLSARGKAAGAQTPAKGGVAAGTSSSQAGSVDSGDARLASRRRREALSRSGKGAARPAERAPSVSADQTHSEVPPAAAGCDCGCDGAKAGAGAEPVTPAGMAQKVVAGRQPRRKALSMTPGRAAALARRQALKARGKSGLSAQATSAAQAVRVANPELSSRELAQAIREQRSRRGAPGSSGAGPCGRTRPNRTGSTANSAQASAGEIGREQLPTGADAGRGRAASGNESANLRNVTGAQHMGAEIFREFSQSEQASAPARGQRARTGGRQEVTGTAVGRAKGLTGNEPGTCQRVTGTDYLPADHDEAWCPAPEKRARGFGAKSPVATGADSGSSTLQGTRISGSRVGRNSHVTGSEPGSCRHVTGDDYLAAEDYADFCASVPASQERKVHVSQTLKGERITGTLSDRTRRITGNEPGSCKAITGTPYAGAETYREFCEADDARAAATRQPRRRATPGADISGVQPGLGGHVRAEMAGSCQTPTGTPYIGTAQYSAACPATPESPDYPQLLDSANAAPAAAAPGGRVTGVLGGSEQITGPFTMAAGKVTGTEEFMAGRSAAAMLPAVQAEVVDEPRGRVTGEGMAPRTPITGDDWDRGDRVTGTEGTSAMRRNPTRRSSVMPAAAQPVDAKRNEDLPAPISKVTGGGGNTEKGAMVTYSGGARG